MKLLFPHLGRSVLLKTLLIAAAGLLFTGWLIETPPGLLGKADAVGYAVCHRIAERSFLVDDRQTPLCARCTGMYLGALLGILYLNRSGRRGGLPPLKVNIVLGVFLFAFALDGGNSYLHFFPGAPGLYQPQNLLRLITGTGMGLGIAAFLAPVFHQAVWQQFSPEPALGTWRQLLSLILLAGVVDMTVWSGNLLLLYPLALLGSAAILLILTMVYTVVWVMVIKKENSFVSLQSMWVPLLAGFATAVLQIAVIDAGRYWLTGTWAGFNL